MQQVKILLDESDIPEHWYNVVADMPNPPAPPLGPDAKPRKDLLLSDGLHPDEKCYRLWAALIRPDLK